MYVVECTVAWWQLRGCRGKPGCCRRCRNDDASKGISTRCNYYFGVEVNINMIPLFLTLVITHYCGSIEGGGEGVCALTDLT